jgi:hypothetical protein
MYLIKQQMYRQKQGFIVTKVTLRKPPVFFNRKNACQSLAVAIKKKCPALYKPGKVVQGFR